MRGRSATGLAATPCSRGRHSKLSARSARTARALGVDGKWVIHPNQIALVNEAFTPSPEEIAHAEEIIAAFNASSGATNLAGLMIDEASKKVAERLLERVTQIRK